MVCGNFWYFSLSITLFILSIAVGLPQGIVGAQEKALAKKECPP